MPADPYLIQAAELAGIKPVTVVKEPEAAALYSIKTLAFSIKKNDVFVVCDAGGGTVDLISYEVLATAPQLKVKEFVPGSGKSSFRCLSRPAMGVL